jgi:virulence-associated protein VagC
LSNLELQSVRLIECNVGGEAPDEEAEAKTSRHRVQIDTDVPDEIGDSVEVRCVYSRIIIEPGETPWRISFLVTMDVTDASVDESDVALAAIQAAHPYVRQLLKQLGALMDNSALSLPAKLPVFTKADLNVSHSG